MEEHWKTLMDRPVEKDDVDREQGLIHVENLKLPYKYAMLEEWARMTDFFEKNSKYLRSKITMDGGTVFHLAASCSSKSQGKPLKMVINGLKKSLALLRGKSTNICDVRSALMDGNNAGNNTLHEVSMTGNKEAAMYLVSIADEEECTLELLETRNSLGETSLFKAAAYGFTDLVKFYVEKLEKYDRDNLWKHFHRKDKTSILHIAVIGQHFETALWLVESNPYLAPLKDDEGLTSLQLLAQMPTAFDPHFEKSIWKMLIYYCLPVGGDVVTPNQDDDVESSRKDDVESSMGSNQPHRQSIFRNKLAGFVKVYISLRDSLARSLLTFCLFFEIGDLIWKDKKNKKALAKLIPALAWWDKSWCTIDATSNETVSLGLEKKGHDDGGKKEKATVSEKTNGHDGGEKEKEAAKSEELNKDGDDGGKKGKAAASDKTNGDDGGEIGKEAAKSEKLNKNGDDGGKKGKAAASDKTNGDDGGEKEKEAAKSEKLDKNGDDGGKNGKAAASYKTNGDDSGGNKEELAKSKEEARRSSPLLIATITGILPIVKEILQQHPQAIEHVNDNNHNILHLAIKYRRKEILNLIQSIPHVMPKLNKRIDNMGNTILHQAADRSYYSISLSQKLIGPAMQLQDELHWMQRVKEIIPPHYTLHHNNKDQTAEELFNQEHNKLLEEAQKWVKETAQSCSTVAVLVATVVFAAAYTIPGGNDPHGRPIFQDNPLFLLFTCMDVVAIASSLSSVAFFLSILSCPLEYPLFVNNIPRKVMAGFVLLFLSMATTMLAFAATVLLLIRVKKKWTMSILYPIAFFPVPLFGLLQFPMYQSFMVMLKTINAWFFKPVFKPLLAVLGFHGSRGSIWNVSKEDEIT